MSERTAEIVLVAVIPRFIYYDATCCFRHLLLCKHYTFQIIFAFDVAKETRVAVVDRYARFIEDNSKYIVAPRKVP